MTELQVSYNTASGEAKKRVDALVNTPANNTGEVMSQFNAIMMDLNLGSSVVTSATGKAHALTWTYVLKMVSKEFKGTGPTQTAAKAIAVGDALAYLKVSLRGQASRIDDARVLLTVALDLGDGEEWLKALSEMWNTLMHMRNGNRKEYVRAKGPALSANRFQVVHEGPYNVIIYGCAYRVFGPFLSKALSTELFELLLTAEMPNMQYNELEYECSCYIQQGEQIPLDTAKAVLAYVRRNSPNMISNELMHAINGNIDACSVLTECEAAEACRRSVRQYGDVGVPMPYAAVEIIRTMCPSSAVPAWKDYGNISGNLAIGDCPYVQMVNVVRLVELQPGMGGECEIRIGGSTVTSTADGLVYVQGVSHVRAHEMSQSGYPIVKCTWVDAVNVPTLPDPFGVDENALAYQAVYRNNGPQVVVGDDFSTGVMVNIVDPKPGDWLVYWMIRAWNSSMPYVRPMSIKFRSKKSAAPAAERSPPISEPAKNLLGLRKPMKMVQSDGYAKAKAASHNKSMHALNGNQYRNDDYKQRNKNRVGRRGNNHRFDGYMNRMGVRGAAKGFVLQMLDTYHDVPFDVVGVPDMNTQRSVVEMVTGQMTINAPEGLPEGTAWDCHVVMTPVFSNIPYAALDNGTPIVDVLPDLGDVYLMGSTVTRKPVTHTYEINGAVAAGNLTNMAHCPIGLCVMKTSVGAPTTGPNVFDSPMFTTECADIDTQFMFGEHRIVGMAFEVANTAPPLYQGGAVTVYRQPFKSYDDPDKAVYSANDGITSTSNYNVVKLQRLPETVDQAKRMVDSVTWEAKHGVYSVSRANEIPALHEPMPAAVIRMPEHEQELGVMVEEQTCGLVAMAHEISGVTDVYPAKNALFSVAKYDVNGAYFTGLSSQTTLELTWRIIVEHVPNPGLGLDAPFQKLARRPPGFSPRALQVLQNVASRLPVAVKLNENFLGGWFDTICDTVQAIAPVIGAAVGQPAVGETAARVVGVIGKTNKALREIKAVKKEVAREKTIVKHVAKKVAAKPKK